MEAGHGVKMAFAELRYAVKNHGYGAGFFRADEPADSMGTFWAVQFEGGMLQRSLRTVVLWSQRFRDGKSLLQSSVDLAVRGVEAGVRHNGTGPCGERSASALVTVRQQVVGAGDTEYRESGSTQEFSNVLLVVSGESNDGANYRLPLDGPSSHYRSRLGLANII